MDHKGLRVIIGVVEQVLMDSSDVRRTLGRLAHEILEAHSGADSLVVAGVLNKGYPVARRLAWAMTQIEGRPVPCGKIDASRFRDDRAFEGEDRSEVPFAIDGRAVVLVDEVIFTGRTIRAALDAVFALGRPSKIELAVLVDRGFRELPIQPDFTGRKVDTDRDDRVLVEISELPDEDRVLLIRGNNG